MVIKTKLHLIAVEERSFTDASGKLVAYQQASLVDTSGNVFRASVNDEADIIVDHGDGEAEVDISSRNEKIKMRLLSFRPLGK